MKKDLKDAGYKTIANDYSPEELKILDEAAKDIGLSRSAFVKSAAIKAAKKTPTYE